MPAIDGRPVRHDGSHDGPDPQTADHAPSRSAVRMPAVRMPAARMPAVRVAGFAVAVAAALGTWLVWWAMVTTWPGQRVEEQVFETADRFQDVVNHLVEPVLLLGSPPWLAAGFLAVCGIGLVRRRWVGAGLAAVVMLGSNLTTQVIKDGVFYRTGLVGEWNRDINTLPSGHVTVVAAAWVALLFVTPRGWRPGTALAGAVATCAMGLATVADRWHRPSDVVAAVLVVLAWAAMACALAPARWADTSPGRAEGGSAPATRLVTVLLGVIAMPAAALSVLAAAATEGHAWAALPWNGGLTAYLGGLLAALAVSAAAFAVLLPLNQAASRPVVPRSASALGGRASARMSAARHKVPTEPP